jgi:hypothetical protein
MMMMMMEVVTKKNKDDNDGEYMLFENTLFLLSTNTFKIKFTQNILRKIK